MEEIADRGVGIQRRVLARVAKVLAPHAWRVHGEGEDMLHWRLIRERGPIRQHLLFVPYLSQGLVSVISKDPEQSGAHVLQPKLQISAFVGFASDLIGAALRNLLPEDAAALDAARSGGGDCFTDMFPRIEEVFAHARPLAGVWLYELAQVDGWTEDFCRWYLDRAAAPLDECRDMPSLNRLVHTRWGLHSASSTWGVHQTLAKLAVVHLCDDPQAPFLDWLGVVRRRQREWSSTPSPENAIVDRLVERLRRRREANA